MSIVELIVFGIVVWIVVTFLKSKNAASGANGGAGGRSGAGAGAGAGAGSGAGGTRKKAGFAIGDSFETLEQVTDALRKAGLESSSLIVAVDFTKSNEWTGKRSFGEKCLHHVADNNNLNPYQRSIATLSRTLSSFDDDGLIPCYGFGCSRSGSHAVFSFQPDDAPCAGLEEALSRYRSVAQSVTLAGPTSFAPIIRKATEIVHETSSYHILVIIADGQISGAGGSGPRSIYEEETIAAIEEASHYPLSIVMVGVGDGPWDEMKKFDDCLENRAFDNFQFVEHQPNMPDPTFALHALMEIPEQYRHCISARRCNRNSPAVTVFPPPDVNATGLKK